LEWNVPAGGVAAVLPFELLLELPLDAGVVVDVVAAFEELPANNAAPMAPPVSVDATNATPTAAFRNGLMLCSLSAFLSCLLQVDPNGSG
jgi:hypothetical protein